jgi:hypothetical protein
MTVDRRAQVRDSRILDVEPDLPVESKAKLVLNRLAPFLSGSSDAAAIDDAFAGGFEFDTHVVEAALGPASVPAEERTTAATATGTSHSQAWSTRECDCWQLSFSTNGSASARRSTC